MCLRTKQTTFLVAQKDIVCYKILKVVHNVGRQNKTLIRSPYYTSYTWNLGELRKSKLTSRPLKYTPYSNDRQINVGFHTFKTRREARINKNDIYLGVIFKCIIPKGSKYYLGTFGEERSYASDQIIVKEKIH